MSRKRPLLTPEVTEEYVASLRKELAVVQENYEAWGDPKTRDRIWQIESEIENLLMVAEEMRRHRKS